MPRWIALLVVGAGATAVAAIALTEADATTSTAPPRWDAAGRRRPSVRERLAGESSIERRFGARHRESPPDDARPRAFLASAASRDAAALASFDAAFAEQGPDAQWSDATERAIRATLAATTGAPVLEHVECRSTLCRAELRGSADMLPTVAPFDGITWWIDGDDGRAQLLLVREDAESPLPAED